jgi:hypothetical protein
VVYRIVAIDDGPHGLVFTTQRDNAAHPDGIVQAERVIGKVAFLIPAIGNAALWVQGR